MLLALALAAAFKAYADEYFSLPQDIAPTRDPVGEVVSTSGIRYKNVVAIGRKEGGGITIRHDAGVARSELFDAVNLDRLFPGYLARKNAFESQKQAGEARRVKRTAEERDLVASKLRAAIEKALHPNDLNLAEREPLVAVLVFGREKYERGDHPQFAVRIVNRSSQAMTLITGHRGTSPQCALSFRDARDTTRWPECGALDQFELMRNLNEKLFARVAPGEAFTPMDCNFGVVDPRANADALSSTRAAPGAFAVTFHYSTKDRELQNYWWPLARAADVPVDAKIRRLFEEVPVVTLRSNEVQITLPE